MVSVRFRPDDGRLIGRWDTGEGIGGVDLLGQFVNPNEAPPAPLPGIGEPSLDRPLELSKLYPLPSKRVVLSILGLTLTIDGVDWAPLVTAFDLVRPMNGETQGVIELRTGRGLSRLDPAANPSLRAGKPVSLSMELPGQTVPLLLGGFVVEPPKFKVEGLNVGSLSIRIGDIFLLKRQSETGQLEPYCGVLPKTTAEAAQIFARVRGLDGVFGGEALVENINPDFIEGAPWDFLSSLYEVLNYDVRSTVQGVPIAVPRTVFNPDTALVLEDYQVSEADWDSPASLPFSKVPAYNSFDRSLGYRVSNTTGENYSRWNPSDTTPWFTNNNSYEVVKTTLLGDTAVQVVTETWGYIPNSAIVFSEDLPGSSTGPCGEFIPPALPVSTWLDIIQTKTYRAYFESHLSGSYVITGTEETVVGWNTYQNSDSDTVLYFGQLQASKSTYQHTAVENVNVCPQYWEVLRVGEDTSEYSRVEVTPNTEPVFQLTQRQVVQWVESQETVSEGQVREWKANRTTQAYDAKNARWIGGQAAPETAQTPPAAQFINVYKVPVSLEAETVFPEFVELFGDRPSKPVQFPNAYTTRDLLTAVDRYARETAGLAYSLHLIVDPRVPIRPGASIIYRRPGTFDVHGLAYAVEFNCTGNEVSQSVILMRTFTEPGLAAIRNNPGYRPASTTDTANPCL